MKNENAEARYRSLIDNSGGGLTVTEVADDGETVNLYTSDGMLHLLHTTREQWNKDHSSDIYAKVHPDDTEKARALFSVPIENGETRSASYRLKGADGSYTWVRVTGTCSVENGKKHIITIHTDITQQKISEQNEYKIKEMLESVLENITCGICAYEYSASDQNSRVLFANKSYYSMFGYTKEQFDIEVTNTFSLVYPDDLPQLLEFIKAADNHDEIHTLDYRCIKRDGELIWVSANEHLTDFCGSSCDILLCETQDITKRKRMDDEKVAMLDQITFLNHAAGDLLSGTDGDSAVEIVLNDIMKYFDGQRSYIFEFNTEKEYASNTYEVCAPGSEPEIDDLQKIPYSDFSTWFDLFERDGYIAISDVSALSDGRVTERELLARQHISSLIVVPLNESGNLIGMVGVDDPTKNVEQLPRLQAIGDYIAVILSRRNMILELEENNLRMTAMMNDTPGGFAQMIIHADNSITPVIINDGFCEMVGMSKNDTYNIFGTDAYAGVHPDDRSRISGLLNDVIDKRSSLTTRIRLQSFNGKYIPMEAHYSVWENPNGRLFLNGYYHDITERLANEDEYRRNIAYRDVNGKGAFGSYHLNVTQNIINDIVSNEPIIRELGKDGTIDGFIKRCAAVQRKNEYSDFISRFSREALLNAVAQGKNQIVFEHSILLSPSRSFWMRTVTDLFRNPETDDVEGFIYDRDVTEEHLLHQMMSTIVNVSYDFIVAINVRTKIYRTFISSSGVITAFHETGVYDSENTINNMLLIVHPDDKNPVFESMQLENMTNELENKLSSEFRYRAVIGDKIKYKRCTFAYLDKYKEYIILSRIDETESMQQLHIALDEAKSSDRAKSTFLSNMSHEIRTPINAIIGLTYLMLNDKSLSDDSRKNLENIKDSGDYLLNIINDILDMSRIESGKFKLNFEWIPVNEILNQCVAMILPSMEAKHIHFEYPDFKRVMNIEYYVDSLKTKQMLMNILSNACKFTAEGGYINLRFKNKFRNDIKAVDYIIVEDNGIGMSSEFVDRLFVPFSQERTISSSSIQGTGLGLALSRQIARAMGGDITVESTPGLGSRFTIEFPYLYRICKEKRVEDQKESVDYLKLLSGKHILLCEDNSLNTIISKKLLENVGCIVDTAINGRQGLDSFKASKRSEYDAVFMDIRMPEMDGLETAKAIRALDREDAKTVPIIAMSANAFEEDRKKSLDAGIDEHLGKPVEPQIMYETLVRLIR